MQEGRSAFKILTGKPTGKIHVDRPWRRWESNIRVDNKRNWVDSAQDRLLESPCECGIVPPGSISHGVSYEKIEGRDSINATGIIIVR